MLYTRQAGATPVCFHFQLVKLWDAWESITIARLEVLFIFWRAWIILSEYLAVLQDGRCARIRAFYDGIFYDTVTSEWLKVLLFFLLYLVALLSAAVAFVLLLKTVGSQDDEDKDDCDDHEEEKYGE